MALRTLNMTTDRGTTVMLEQITSSVRDGPTLETGSRSRGV